MLAGNKHVILTQKIKKTSSRLDENGPENKESQKLISGTLRVSRRHSETLSRYATGGNYHNNPHLIIGLTRLLCRFLKPSRYVKEIAVGVAGWRRSGESSGRQKGRPRRWGSLRIED
ncbi:hypothetical protein E3N88_22609 [Mikania micrantha]|uniref:Uncharacterized protein n=1 Tax=Mikania micrantha TaxID=192012 RepID=A0A5N6NDG8_9ASTR|nr:hypothetical protein E3N88_22609 [Mikania micrantha]